MRSRRPDHRAGRRRGVPRCRQPSEPPRRVRPILPDSRPRVGACIDRGVQSSERPGVPADSRLPARRLHHAGHDLHLIVEPPHRGCCRSHYPRSRPMTATLDLTATQIKHALGIIAACKARKLPHDQRKRLADIALETALTESGLRMYANVNNPESLRLSHDAVGSDHGSVGLFQQQVGGAVNSTADWGTTAELMDPEVSTRKFLNALLRLDWISMTNWAAAQAVQHSAFADGSNYRNNDGRAIKIRKALWDTVDPPPAPKPNHVPAHKPVHVVAPGDTLFSIAQAWGTSLQAVEHANPGAGHPAGNFGNIRPGDRIVHP